MEPDAAILLRGPLERLRGAEKVLHGAGIHATVVRPPDADAGG